MFEFLQTLLALLVALSLLIAVHELGHFLVARWCGVKVVRFSIGFGRPLWQRTFGADSTEFTLATIPLGGYVKMVDEREGDVAEVTCHEPSTASPWVDVLPLSLLGRPLILSSPLPPTG
jgi:regulator of sigma E protease